MNKLIQVVEAIRAKLEVLRRHCLKETPTRTIVIDPLLEALGWDVRDPDEVQLEYPTIDGKSVDYALKLNKKPVLLVEAKPLDDPLENVKDVTQVVGYAANAGIVWCILTSGVKWRVYRSVENCPAPDKLMFEVNLAPDASEGMTVEQIARQMWRFSREEMAKGTLDAIGEETFTDGKVRKAFAKIMLDPPRPLLNIIRRATGDQAITPQQIKNSLSRIARDFGGAAQVAFTASSITPPPGKVRAPRAGKSESKYSEAHHIAGKPQESVELYRGLDRLCLSIEPGGVGKRFLAKCISYDRGKRTFCSANIQQTGMRVWLRLKYSRLANAPSFARDVSSVGHWGVGNLELAISSLAQLQEAESLIRQSFEESTA